MKIRRFGLSAMAVLPAAMLPCAPAMAAAQLVVPISSEPRLCEIVLDEVLSLGAQAGADPELYVPLDPNRMLDGVVEVIDVRTGQLVARTVLDEVLWWTGDRSLLYSIREDGLIPKAVLFAPSLAGEGCSGSQG